MPIPLEQIIYAHDKEQLVGSRWLADELNVVGEARLLSYGLLSVRRLLRRLIVG